MRRVRVPDLAATFTADGRLFIRSVSARAGARVPPFAAAVLAACTAPRTAEEIGDLLGPPARTVYLQLAEAGLLVTPEEADERPVLFGAFAAIEVHRRMLADDVRLQAYEAALRATIRPGDVVADAGTGTGVLAVLAAKAGAARVYAIEKTDFADVAERVAADSGVADRVSVVRGDFGKVQLPEPVDVVVTETFGAWALDEGALPSLSAFVERNLAPGGRIVPRAIELWAAGLDGVSDDHLSPFVLRPDGVDLRSLRAEALGRAQLSRPPADLLRDPQRLARIDLPGPPRAAGTLVLSAPCGAVVGWFVLDLAEGVRLSSAPDAPPTHWSNPVLAVPLPAGRHALTIEPSPEDRDALVVGLADREIRVR